MTSTGEVVERPIETYDGPIQVPLPMPRPPQVDRPNNTRFRRFRLPSEMDGEDNQGQPSQVSPLDAWLADHKARTRDDLPVYHMRGYRGVTSQIHFINGGGVVLNSNQKG
ncbi:hypothetical protein RHMOL_Rhmol04G0352800 [Rhododendron molle]|uniref:Uncharacterized protein n=1 Tax=Rhododendron molle TaxID=49168 RepID=A0ACC0P8R2_RHOML|nr:hypothetical protein RHMOL_Rhmol04G0352800 [Rhododendron molle]